MGPSWTLTNLANVRPRPGRPGKRSTRNLQSETRCLARSRAQASPRASSTRRPHSSRTLTARSRRTHQRINDQMAELAAKHPGKLYGLATVDAFRGDAAARELTRAVKELGLRGVFVESARARPPARRQGDASDAAGGGDLGVPVFVHPLTDPELHKRFSRTGRIGVRLARGTINNAALINMLESGTFDEIPKLQVVMTTLAMGGMLLAGGFGDGSRYPQRRAGTDAPPRLCRHHGHPSGHGPRRRRPARRRSRADGHRLADRRGEVRAGRARRSRKGCPAASNSGS